MESYHWKEGDSPEEESETPWLSNSGSARCNGVFTPEQDNDKTNVEPVHSYEAFHTRSGNDSVKGIIGMHRLDL